MNTRRTLLSAIAGSAVAVALADLRPAAAKGTTDICSPCADDGECLEGLYCGASGVCGPIPFVCQGSFYSCNTHRRFACKGGTKPVCVRRRRGNIKHEKKATLLCAPLS